MNYSWGLIKRAKARVKLHLGMPNYRHQVARFASDKPRVFLIGTPIHDNLGDHLLALSALEELKRAFASTHMILEIPTELYMLEHDSIVNSLGMNDIVAVAGGGWMGNLWPHDDAILRDIVCSAQQTCPVIVLPQTVYYSDDLPTYPADLNEARGFWHTSRAVLCLREQASFRTAISSLSIPEERVRLLSDLGIVYRAPAFECERTGVLVCLRSDRECVGNWNDKALAYAEALDSEVRATSTLAEKVVPVSMRQEKVEGKIREFASAKLVVTDRLHGLIFSVLAHTPCIYFDNATGKVSGVAAAWLDGLIGIADGTDKAADELVRRIVDEENQTSWWTAFDKRQNQLSLQIEQALKEMISYAR